MAPNNGLGVAEPNHNGEEKRMTKNGTTTILPKGTVESRGMGTNAESREVVSQEIQDFIDGEGRTLWAEVRSFFTVWLFVSRLPSPSWVDAHPGYLMRGMTYFPICGAIIGIIVSSFYDVSSSTLSLPLVISSCIAEAVSLWCTGCFHEDGLADSADGIGGGWSRDQILKIMQDTRLGTFGCAALLLYMMGKVELIAMLGNSVWEVGACEGGGPAIIVTQSLSRLVAPILINTRNYVDEGGPKYQFYSFFLEAKYLVTWSRALFATIASLVISSLSYGFVKGAGLIIVVVVMAFLSGQYGDRILGGVMGDFIGATICITEMVLLTTIVSWGSFDEHITLWGDLRVLLTGAVNGDTSIQAVKDEVLSNHQTFALFKFAVAVSLLTIWCKNVGHVPIVDASSAKNDEPDENKKSSKDRGEISDMKDGGKSSELQSYLSDPKQDFTSRYNIARGYLDSLAKPVGSLGTLEDWAARMAALQGTIKPNAKNVACLIFAADHGVAKDVKDGGMNCSAYPQQVTRKVLEGLDHGIAGASVLARSNNVSLRVVDVGVADAVKESTWSGDAVRPAEFMVKGGTKNFCTGGALSSEQLDRCLLVGRKETGKIIEETDATVVLFGEVGIGNTTTSSTLIASLTGADVELLCGSGAATSRDGVNDEIVTKKISIVKEAMKHHGAQEMIGKPMNALKCVGGAEIVSMVGGMLEASERSLPILIDGFIVTTAAMIACQVDPTVCRCLLFATKSTEVGQDIALKTIATIAKDNGIPDLPKPALDMSLRMGEATGALSAVALLRSACAVVSELATLEEVLSLEAKTSQDPK